MPDPNSTFCAGHHCRRLRRLISAGLGLLLLPTVATADIPIEEGICRPIPGSDIRLCVHNQNGREADWSLVPGGPVAIPMSAAGVYDLSVSPDGAWLAVIAVGEGHPILDLIAIGDLVAKGETGKAIAIDPYPGSIWLEEWDGAALHLSSSAPLDRATPADAMDRQYEYHYRLATADFHLQHDSISVAAPELIAFPILYDTGKGTWHSDCALAEGDRKRAADNLSWLHLALPAGRILALEVAISQTLQGDQPARDCVASLLQAINLPPETPVEIQYRHETLPETTGVQIEMKVVSRPPAE